MDWILYREPWAHLLSNMRNDVSKKMYGAEGNFSKAMASYLKTSR